MELKLIPFILLVVKLILTTLFISIFPLIVIFYGILSLYRFIIFKIAKYSDPSLGKMVSAISNFFAAHDIYGNSFTINIALHFVGRIDKYHVIQGFKKLMEEYKNPDGSFLYPELTQRVVKRYGYTFWRNIDNFQFEDHVQYLNESKPEDPVTLDDIRELIAKFGKTPLDKNRSPWVVYIVRNFQNPKDSSVKSAVILRLHHCMFDGQAVLNLFGKMADNGPFTLEGLQKMKDLENDSSRSEIGHFVKVILRVFFGSYYLMGQLLSFDRNELMHRNWSDFKGVMRFHECELIPLGELKRLKNYYGVTMSSFLTTLCVRSLKRFMEKRECSPKKIRMSFPLLVPNHPDKLRNVFAAGIISFNLQHDDRVKLLHSVDKKMKRFKYAYTVGLPEASMFLLRILGSLPYFLVPKIDETVLSTTLMNSSIPGPIETGYFCGFPIVDATAAGSIAKAFPVGTLSFSYRGFYKFGWAGDISIFPSQEDIDELGKGVMEELQHFQREMEEDNV